MVAGRIFHVLKLHIMLQYRLTSIKQGYILHEEYDSCFISGFLALYPATCGIKDCQDEAFPSRFLSCLGYLTLGIHSSESIFQTFLWFSDLKYSSLRSQAFHSWNVIECLYQYMCCFSGNEVNKDFDGFFLSFCCLRNA